MYGNYREDNILGPKVVSLVERSNIQCPFLGGSTIGGSTVLYTACIKNSTRKDISQLRSVDGE